MTLEQIEEIKEKRLSGNYTLQEIGNQYGVTRERIRQIVGVPNLRKHLEKMCINCGNTFIITNVTRNLCRAGCKPPHKERPCSDCNSLFTPKNRGTFQGLRCATCYVIYRKIRGYEAMKKYHLKLKKLGVKRLNNPSPKH
jgi:hypothetical protein